MTTLPTATIRKTAARLTPGDVVHAMPISNTSGYALSWHGKRDDIEVKTVASNEKGTGENKGSRYITFTDGTTCSEMSSTKARLVSETATAPVAAESETDATVADEDGFVPCTTMRGGVVHTGMITDGDVFPLCRSGGQDSRGTQYRTVEGAELTCKTCKIYRDRRDIVRSTAAVEPAEEPIMAPASTDTDYVRCTSGPRGKVHLGLRVIADYVVPTCTGKSRGSARYSVIEPTADITCKRCLTRYGIMTEEPTPVESTGDDRVAVNVHPHIAAYVSGRRGSDPIERALAEILSDVVLHPERATGHSMTTITGADSATKDGLTTPLLQVDLTIDQANVLYRLTAELAESTDPDMQVYRRYSLSGLSQLRAAGIRPADTVAVNLPLSLFGHLGAEGYADDQVSMRRRNLYAELAAAPQCRMRRVLHVTATLSDLSANTLFDAMLDLWKLRRRGASDLRRAALGVLADLQAVGVRSDEYLPTGTSADPVMTGVETLRSLLRL